MNVSSAKRPESALSWHNIKSLIYVKNNNGPNEKPCGTRHIKFLKLESKPLSETNCFLFAR